MNCWLLFTFSSGLEEKASLADWKVGEQSEKGLDGLGQLGLCRKQPTPTTPAMAHSVIPTTTITKVPVQIMIDEGNTINTINTINT